jgi:hypothetical protein
VSSIPENFRTVTGKSKNADISDLESRRVGVTTYQNFYSNEEMKEMERHIEETE